MLKCLSDYDVFITDEFIKFCANPLLFIDKLLKISIYNCL